MLSTNIALDFITTLPTSFTINESTFDYHASQAITALAEECSSSPEKAAACFASMHQSIMTTTSSQQQQETSSSSSLLLEKQIRRFSHLWVLLMTGVERALLLSTATEQEQREKSISLNCVSNCQRGFFVGILSLLATNSTKRKELLMLCKLIDEISTLWSSCISSQQQNVTSMDPASIIAFLDGTGRIIQQFIRIIIGMSSSSSSSSTTTTKSKEKSSMINVEPTQLNLMSIICSLRLCKLTTQFLLSEKYFPQRFFASSSSSSSSINETTKFVDICCKNMIEILQIFVSFLKQSSCRGIFKSFSLFENGIEVISSTLLLSCNNNSNNKFKCQVLSEVSSTLLDVLTFSSTATTTSQQQQSVSRQWKNALVSFECSSSENKIEKGFSVLLQLCCDCLKLGVGGDVVAKSIFFGNDDDQQQQEKKESHSYLFINILLSLMEQMTMITSPNNNSRNSVLCSSTFVICCSLLKCLTFSSSSGSTSMLNIDHLQRLLGLVSSPSSSQNVTTTKKTIQLVTEFATEICFYKPHVCIPFLFQRLNNNNDNNNNNNSNEYDDQSQQVEIMIVARMLISLKEKILDCHKVQKQQQQGEEKEVHDNSSSSNAFNSNLHCLSIIERICLEWINLSTEVRELLSEEFVSMKRDLKVIVKYFEMLFLFSTEFEISSSSSSLNSTLEKMKQTILLQLFSTNNNNNNTLSDRGKITSQVLINCSSITSSTFIVIVFARFLVLAQQNANKHSSSSATTISSATSLVLTPGDIARNFNTEQNQKSSSCSSSSSVDKNKTTTNFDTVLISALNTWIASSISQKEHHHHMNEETNEKNLKILLKTLFQEAVLTSPGNYILVQFLGSEEFKKNFYHNNNNLGEKLFKFVLEEIVISALTTTTTIIQTSIQQSSSSSDELHTAIAPLICLRLIPSYLIQKSESSKNLLFEKLLMLIPKTTTNEGRKEKATSTSSSSAASAASSPSSTIVVVNDNDEDDQETTTSANNNKLKTYWKFAEYRKMIAESLSTIFPISSKLVSVIKENVKSQKNEEEEEDDDDDDEMRRFFMLVACQSLMKFSSETFSQQEEEEEEKTEENLSLSSCVIQLSMHLAKSSFEILSREMKKKQNNSMQKTLNACFDSVAISFIGILAVSFLKQNSQNSSNNLLLLKDWYFLETQQNLLGAISSRAITSIFQRQMIPLNSSSSSSSTSKNKSELLQFFIWTCISSEICSSLNKLLFVEEKYEEDDDEEEDLIDWTTSLFQTLGLITNICVASYSVVAIEENIFPIEVFDLILKIFSNSCSSSSNNNDNNNKKNLSRLCSFGALKVLGSLLTKIPNELLLNNNNSNNNNPKLMEEVKTALTKLLIEGKKENFLQSEALMLTEQLILFCG